MDPTDRSSESILDLYQLDTFSDHVFGGNPAAVVLLWEWLEDWRMQAIAEENNLSETAFLVRRGLEFELRWFTPLCEVPLCGHATLAAAWVVFHRLDHAPDRVGFQTASGRLEATRNGNGSISVELPSLEAELVTPPAHLAGGLHSTPSEVLRTTSDPNYHAVFEREDQVRNLSPDLQVLELLHPHGIVVTAPGRTVDFVCRYFAPGYGISEDLVTGSIQAALVPYWADRLGRTVLRAHQLSKRGGFLECEDLRGRVRLTGHVARYLEGRITV